MLKLTFVVLAATAGLTAAGLGLVPAWTIAPASAAGLLLWGVLEYLGERPASGQG